MLNPHSSHLKKKWPGPPGSGAVPLDFEPRPPASYPPIWPPDHGTKKIHGVNFRKKNDF